MVILGAGVKPILPVKTEIFNLASWLPFAEMSTMRIS
jgi:hypothetical protein